MLSSRTLIVAILSLLGVTSSAAEHASPPVPEDFPRFVVPGQEKEMDSLRRLFWLHYQPAGPLIPLWDEWLPMSTLWPAVGATGELEAMRRRWAAALAGRVINAEGYVHTHQHDGLAHAEGWPFPLWTQAGGVGWHFRGTGIGGYDAPLATADGWTLSQARSGNIGPKGWEVQLSEPGAVAQAPAFAVEARISPWLRLNWWAAGLDGAPCYVEWTTKDAPDFSAERRAYFAPAGTYGQAQANQTTETANQPNTEVIETRTMISVYRLEGWKGTITGLRIGFSNAGPAHVVIKSFHTACDTRHNINNANFIRGCHDYFFWTRDDEFLRNQIGRVRTAMRFILREFDTRHRKCVYTTWPGHEGRSGVRYVDGQKVIIPGEGIGSNYWDLMPFGGEDALATVYYYDALQDLAELEEQISGHPQWSVAAGADAFDPADLRRHAGEVKDYGTRRFWNEKTGRFGTVDLDGTLHDYGFTFLNNEAIYYGFEIRTLLLPLGQLRRTARRHGRQPVQGLRPGPAVHQVHQRQVRRAAVCADHHPAGASFKDMVALKGKPDIGDQINKKIIAPLAKANKLSDIPDFNDADQARQRQGDGGPADQPDRHLREPGARLSRRTAPTATTSWATPTST
jgi:hypothetical protein